MNVKIVVAVRNIHAAKALNVTEQTLNIVMKDTGKGWKQEEKEGLLQA